MLERQITERIRQGGTRRVLYRSDLYPPGGSISKGWEIFRTGPLTPAELLQIANNRPASFASRGKPILCILPIVPVNSSFKALVLDQLGRVIPGIRARPMFGGVGIYSDENFFALIANDTVYLKVDESTRADFEARGMGPFRPFGDDGGRMKYYQLPEDLLEDPEALRPWAEKAVTIARESKARRPSRGRGA